MVSMGVLSDDFATVDVREELCYHCRPKKRKFKRRNERQKPIKESIARRKKRQPSPERFSGDGSAPPRLSVWFSALFLLPFRGVAWLRRVSAAHLSMPSTRHGAKQRIYVIFTN